MKEISFGSQCVHDLKNNKTTEPHQLPIYATSSFVFENIEQGIDIFSGKQHGHVYGRYGNPTMETVARKIAALEAHGTGKEAFGVMLSSGMAAISTLMLSLLDAGDQIITQENLYGGSTVLINKVLKPKGIDVIFADLKDADKLEQALKQNKGIKLLYFETPANPTMACLDMEIITTLAKKHNILTAIDNTFCSPYLQQPLHFGVDFVIHSSTKYLNGHGNSISGAIVSHDQEAMENKILKTLRMLGTNCNPFDAWLLNNGMKTLEIRMERHSSNAMKVAGFLENHPKIAKVNYVGLASHPDYAVAKKQMKGPGGMMSFELQGGLDAGIKFMNKIAFCALTPTLGNVDSLIVHPASMSHINVDREIRLRNGITDGLIRLSVGIETPEDIIADLDQALG